MAKQKTHLEVIQGYQFNLVAIAKFDKEKFIRLYKGQIDVDINKLWAEICALAVKKGLRKKDEPKKKK